MITDMIPKIYTKGAIGRGSEILKIFNEYGIKNPNRYRFGDPDAIYYADENATIQRAEYKSPKYYSIINDNEWEPITIKNTKIERKFLITVKEGSSSCDGCKLGKKCKPKDAQKCNIIKQLSNLIDSPELCGNSAVILDVTDKFPPLSPYSKYDF